MTKINCIIVDDEPLALKLIEGYVDKTPFLNLVGKCRNAMEALEVLENKEVDLMFLDIQMPNLNGLELSRMVKNDVKLIFTTAFEKYAIEGYKVNALDYLLKPFDYNEFLVASLKAKNKVSKVNETVSEDYILVKSDYKVQQIDLRDILYIEGIKDYIKIHRTNNQPYIKSLMSMKGVEEKLPSTVFMRVHRSYIVNLNQIKIIEKSRIIFDKVYIPVSDKYKGEFQTFLSSRFLVK
jgi:DNA-binding LytR/AlgR family response regulator